MNTRPKRNDPAPGSARPDYFWPFMICLTLLMGTVVYHFSTLPRERASMATNSSPVAVTEPDAATRTEKPRLYPPASARRVAAPVTSDTDIVAVPTNTSGATLAGEKGDNVVVVRTGMPAFGNYTQTLPGSTVTIEMVAIPGGEMVLGSPADEPGREESDRPQRKVRVPPFYMGKYEITWEQYLPYVFLDQAEVARFSNRLEGIVDKDGISHPTKPYGSVYRDRGEKAANPALGMSQLAAVNYCRWLSHKTGQPFRLPTEDEWEYACRAGSSAAYFWGANPSRAREYGWFVDDAGELTHPVGKLKPNKFGLYDIVGNVGEWCGGETAGAGNVLRGGDFTEPATRLRSAARLLETDAWNDSDPLTPQSVWWVSSADFAGFRVVRALDSEGSTNATPATAMAEPAAQFPREAREIYAGQCRGCHGATGRGNTALGRKRGARDYTTPGVKATFNGRQWREAIKEGLRRDGQTIMGAYKDKLTDQEISDLLQFMKTL